MDARLTLPPEWAPHRALWTAWPWDRREWGGDVGPARAAIAAMIRALGPGENVRVLARPGEAAHAARAALPAFVEIFEADYGDVWLRDTGPIFARRGGGERIALGFQNNGWGGKYVMEGDERVAAQIAAAASTPLIAHDFVLEGGAIEHDGAGHILTTAQCLLNANRNGWTKADAEAALREALGARAVLWLEAGLANDHTDGHIDNLARFVGPGRVVCQHAALGDPNAATLEAIAEALSRMRDADGRLLQVETIPSPGGVRDAAGDALPASHMNFIIGNKAVIVPVYSERGEDAVAALAPLFPGRAVIGVEAHGLIAGGGAFHCITQQEPA